MTAVLNAIFPVFALIFLGWWVARKRILDSSASHVLTRYVALIALPALLFNVSANRPWHEVLHWGVISSFGIAMMCCFGVAFYLCNRRGEGRAAAALDGMNASYANTGFMGIPLLSLLIGDAALAPAVTSTLLTATILFSLTVAIMASATPTSSERQKALGIALGLLRNPLVVAPALGMVVSITDLPVPTVANNLLTLLAAPAAPTALFAIGLFLAGLNASATPSRPAKLLTLLSLKLLVQPLIAGVLAYYAFNMPPYWALSITLLSATPLGTGPFMLANLYHQDISETTRLILYSTLLSVLSLSLLIHFLPMR